MRQAGQANLDPGLVPLAQPGYQAARSQTGRLRVGRLFAGGPRGGTQAS